MKNIHIFFFSGTGNTEFVVNTFVDQIKSRVFSVVAERITATLQYKIEPDAILGLFFPANSMSISPFVWKFIRQLPKSTRSAPVFAVCTLNESTAVSNSLKTVLKNKGYKPFLYAEMSMPNNVSFAEFDGDVDKIRVKIAELRIAEIVDSVAHLRETWAPDSGNRFSGFLSLSTPLVFSSMRAFFKLRTDTEKCTRCGVCVASCPVDNIVMDDIPKHMSKCQLCMRCVAECPEQAIMVKSKDFRVRKFAETLVS